MEHITWTRATGIGRSGWDGTVNGRQLFTIEMSVVRGEGWKLRTRLPFNIKPEHSVSQDSVLLKRTAERVLRTFVTSLGASLPVVPKKQS